MRSEERERIRKRHDELHHNRKNTQDRRNVSSEVRPQHSRSNNRVEMHESSRYKKDERRKPQFSSVATKRSNERSRRDTSLIGQHDRVHRNSPVELVYRGCRNTDSPSSSSSGEENDDQNACQRKSGGSRSRKRRHYEESVKELSARKKQIESELRALDEEEAAEAEKKKFRNNSNHQQHQERHIEERIVRIRQDPGNDNERTNNRNKRIEQAKRLVRVKQEPVSDEDKRNGVRPKKSHKKTHPPLHIKQERDHSSPSRHHRAHHSNDNGRRRNITSDSRDITNMEWGKSSSSSEKGEKKEVKEKEKPNFETSGKLAEDTNTYNGVVIKYNEPSEARKPRRKWRLYPFKGDSSLPFIPVHRQSAYLLGRSRLIADIPIDHPSCSKQHAVLQFRLTPYTREDGTKGRSVRPYIIDLDSSNGTFINNKRIEPRRYMELLEKDVLKFGFSSRVYVILHEDSKNEDDNDDEAED